MEPDESISGILEEISFADTMAELEDIMGMRDFNKVVEVKLYSTEMYELIIEFDRAMEEARAHQRNRVKPMEDDADFADARCEYTFFGLHA